jgi:hypothetical protein
VFRVVILGDGFSSGWIQWHDMVMSSLVYMIWGRGCLML